MPVHDWTKVDAGGFHGFHGRWITHITTTLNSGLLPDGYFADGEQVTRDKADVDDARRVGDIIALQPRPRLFDDPPRDVGELVEDAPPQAQVHLTLRVVEAPRRHVVIRHKTGHRVVALIEIVSPANKDRPGHIEDFTKKVADALKAGIHVMVLDLFPPGRHDPNGLHDALVGHLEPDEYALPGERVRTLASYVGGPGDAYLEHPSVGDPLPVMPLFLTPDRYVNLPLEPSYQLAWSGTPYIYREVLEPT